MTSNDTAVNNDFVEDVILERWSQDLNLSDNEKKIFNKLLSIIEKINPFLVTNKPRALSQSDRNKIETIINKSGRYSDQEKCKDLLTRLISHQVKQGYLKNSSQPTVSYTLLRDPPVLQAQQMMCLYGYRRLLKEYYQSFENLKELTRDEFIGMILFSAISESALLKEIQHVEFLKSSPQDFGVTENQMFVVLNMKKRMRLAEDAEIDGHEIFRCFISQINELLLYRYWHIYGENGYICKNKPRKKPFYYILKYLKSLGLTKNALPKTFVQLSKWAESWYAIYLSPSLLTVLRGGYKTTPLECRSWLRFYSGEKVTDYNNKRGLIKKQKEWLDVKDDSVKNIFPLISQREFISKISTILRKNKKIKNKKGKYIPLSYEKKYKKIGSILAKNRNKITYITWLICAWMYYLLKNGGTTTSRLKGATLTRYLGALKNHLLPAFSDCLSEDLTSNEWLERLQLAIDNHTDSLAPTVIGRFLEFLQMQRCVPKLDIGSLEGLEHVSWVNANCISIKDFESAVDLIETKTDEQRKMCQLAAALGFYAGLRRSEVKSILLSDIYSMAKPCLLVRSNKHYDVKSYNSQRKLPLHALLPEKWLKRLLEWRKYRRSSANDKYSRELLFCESVTPHTRQTDGYLINPIVNALRIQTADESIVFHHLRHSFANWSYLKLLIAEQPELGFSNYTALQHKEFSNDHCLTFRSKLLKMERKDTPIRHALYAVSTLLGHKSPNVTLRNYIHIVDVVIHETLKQKVYHLTDVAQRILLGYRKRDGGELTAIDYKWYRLRKSFQSDKNFIPSVAVAAERNRYVDILPDSSLEYISRKKMQKPILKVEISDNKKSVEIIDIKDISALLFKKEKSIHSVSDELGFSEADVNRVKIITEALCSLTTRVRNRKPNKKNKNPDRHKRFKEIPYLPYNRMEHKIIKRILRKDFEKINIDSLRPGLDLFVSRQSPTYSGRIMLKSRADEEAYFRMLKALGIKYKEIFYMIYKPRNIDVDIDDFLAYEAHESVKYLPKSNIIVRCNQVEKLVGADQRPYTSISTITTRDYMPQYSNKPKYVNSYGLRYSLDVLVRYLMFTGEFWPACLADGNH